MYCREGGARRRQSEAPPPFWPLNPLSGIAADHKFVLTHFCILTDLADRVQPIQWRNRVQAYPINSHRFCANPSRHPHPQPLIWPRLWTTIESTDTTVECDRCGTQQRCARVPRLQNQLQYTLCPKKNRHGVLYALILSNVNRFLPRDAMLSAVGLYAVVVCLCVTLPYCIKKQDHANNAARQPQDSSYLMPKIMAKFEWDRPLRGDKCRWVGLKLVTFDEKRAITRKHYKIDVQFLLKSNRKSYALYQMAMFPMTLGDP